MKFRHGVWGRIKKYTTNATINSAPAPMTRRSGRRELFRATGAASGMRGVCGPAGAWPNVSGAGLANILVYSPGPCDAILGAGPVGDDAGDDAGNDGGNDGGGEGLVGLNTCVALDEESGGGTAGAIGGGMDGMESRPKICVNSPTPFGAGGGGVSGAMCCAPPPAGGVIGD
jgi:hypothetical protein